MSSTLLRLALASDKGEKVRKKPNRLAVRFFYIPLRLRLEDRLHLGKIKKTEFFLVFRSICTIFAPDFKGCPLVRAEMIPSHLIRIIPA